jgi:hypothetical protein
MPQALILESDVPGIAAPREALRRLLRVVPLDRGEWLVVVGRALIAPAPVRRSKSGGRS